MKSLNIEDESFLSFECFKFAALVLAWLDLSVFVCTKVKLFSTKIKQDKNLFISMHRGAFCQFTLLWIYYYGSNESTGKETGKTHLCAMFKFFNPAFYNHSCTYFILSFMSLSLFPYIYFSNYDVCM